MKKFTYRLLILVSLMISTCTSAMACTNITIKAADNSVMIGRTLEFAAELQSYIMTSPRGRVFNTTTPAGKSGLSWKAKYGYLLLDYFNTGHPVDGMNEKGLSFGYLYMPGYTEYPSLTANNTHRSLPNSNLGDWLLGNFSTVAEVKKALKNIVIYDKPETILGHKNTSFPLHAIVTDAKGDSIVIEFSHGVTKVYDDPIGILTNAPTFPWQLSNLKNYANLSPYSPAPISVDGFTYAGTGQGSGMVGLPGDTTPTSRFVKMTLFSQYAAPVNNAKDALTLTQHILNAVDIPIGPVRAQKGSTSPDERTQWTVYKDLTHHVLYYTSYYNSALQSIDMNKLNFSPNAPQLKIPVASQQTIIDATKRMNQVR